MMNLKYFSFLNETKIFALDSQKIFSKLFKLQCGYSITFVFLPQFSCAMC